LNRAKAGDPHVARSTGGLGQRGDLPQLVGVEKAPKAPWEKAAELNPHDQTYRFNIQYLTKKREQQQEPE
jgi:hypothetical protein